MKQNYETPKLIVHGTVEEMTKAFAPSNARDTIYLGGPQAPATGIGSQDAGVYPL